MSNSIVAVDFDGTCVTHDYPKVGHDVFGAAVVLRELSKLGVKIILLTMRGDRRQAVDPDTGLNVLAAARLWFEERNIKLFGVNENPEQSSWTSSKKVYAHAYIDDAAAGCPLVMFAASDRPAVNWPVIALNLAFRGIMPFYYKNGNVDRLTWPGGAEAVAGYIKPTKAAYEAFMKEHHKWDL